MFLVVLEYVLLVIVSYFIGNISFARLISKNKNEDITKKGSGNPGTMNMLRNYGIKIGAITLILDVLKGVLPSLAGLLLFRYTGLNESVGLLVAGLSVIVGHMWPVLYKFKGGKGVACALGVFMVANPLWLLISFVIGFVYLWFFDYGSVASLFIVAFMTIIQGWQFNQNYLDGILPLESLLTINILLFLIFSLIWFAHRSNIIRLLMGKENKANLQKSFKKKLSKQKIDEVKSEYKEEKSELKTEFKKLKAEYKKDRREKKRSLKTQYKNIKSQLKKSNADIITNELETDIPKYVQTSLDIQDSTNNSNSDGNAKKQKKAVAKPKKVATKVNK